MPDTKLIESLVKTCENKGIPYQREIVVSVIRFYCFRRVRRGRRECFDTDKVYTYPSPNTKSF